MNRPVQFLKVILMYSSVIVSFATVLQGISNLISSDILFNPGFMRLFVVSLGSWSIYFNISRISFRTSSAFTILIYVFGFTLYPIYAREIDASDILISIISMLILTIVPHTLINPITNVKWIWAWNIFIFFSAIIGVYFAIEKIQFQNTFSGFANIFIDEPFIPFAFLGAFIFINSIIFRYQTSNYLLNSQIVRMNHDLESQIQDVNNQQKDLAKQNDQLISLQNDLRKMNENLEEEVEKRTKKINDLTSTVLRYGFLNSHLLRAPVSRMQSVINAWDILDQNDRDRFIDGSMKELDQVMNLLRELINKKDLKSKEIETFIIDHYKNLN